MSTPPPESGNGMPQQPGGQPYWAPQPGQDGPPPLPNSPRPYWESAPSPEQGFETPANEPYPTMPYQFNEPAPGAGDATLVGPPNDPYQFADPNEPPTPAAGQPSPAQPYQFGSPNVPTGMPSPGQPQQYGSPNMPVGMPSPAQPYQFGSPNVPTGLPSPGQPQQYGSPNMPVGMPSPAQPYQFGSPNAPTGLPSPGQPQQYGSPNMPVGMPSANSPQGTYQPQGAYLPPMAPVPPQSPTGPQESGQANPFQPSAETQAKMKRRRTIVIAALAAVALIVAAVLGIGWWNTSRGEKASQEAMENLLAALERGDAPGALALLDTPYDTAAEPLLAADALTAGGFSYVPGVTNMGKGPDGYDYQTTVTINGTSKVVEWTVGNSTGDWLVVADDVVTELDLNAAMPYVINGIEIPAKTETIHALPGSYAVTSGLPLLTYDPAKSSFDLYSGNYQALDLDFTLAEGAQNQVIEQVRALLNLCVTETSPPTLCNWPLEFNNGTVTPGTVTWQLSPADPVATLTVPLDNVSADSGYHAVMPLSFDTIASGQGTLADGSAGIFENITSNRQTVFIINLSGEAPVVSIDVSGG